MNNNTLASLELHMHLLLQEIPFGLVVNFSEPALGYLEIPYGALTEEQIQTVVNDIQKQRRDFFDKECKKWE